jgi:hypothetical protein
MQFKIESNSNSISIRNQEKNIDISFLVEGIELPTDLSHDFAAWLLMPIAMLAGEDLHIAGNLDSQVIANANKLSALWYLWRPEIYSSIKITSDTCSTPLPLEKNADDLILFSGGVDSTHALLKIGQRAETGTVLTIHGMDYRHEDQDRFSALVEKTQPLLELLNYRRIVVKTNIFKYTGPSDSGHGFLLAGVLFMFSQQFKRGVIASDFTWIQDMMVAPWGTNHVSNQYFSGHDFFMETVSSEYSRARKIAAIAASPAALQSISFCKSHKSRPHNCGKCLKCIRTKTMFIANSGTCPDIFLDRSFTAEDVAKIDLDKKMDFVFFHDVISLALENGHIEQLSELNRKLQTYISQAKALYNKKPSRLQRLNRKLKKLLIS